jgi:hypothetical protein
VIICECHCHALPPFRVGQPLFGSVVALRFLKGIPHIREHGFQVIWLSARNIAVTHCQSARRQNAICWWYQMQEEAGAGWGTAVKAREEALLPVYRQVCSLWLLGRHML